VIVMKQCSYAQAVAEVSGNGIKGTVWFGQRQDGVLVTAEINGLPHDGFYAFHIHEGSACDDSGGHFNPAGVPHPEHAGDLPPLLACKGRAFLSVLADRFCVEDIMNRTVVIHSGTDDFRSQPAGNPGEKLACGGIRRNW
jgi:Cu-Zn family superoxide dismutase